MGANRFKATLLSAPSSLPYCARVPGQYCRVKARFAGRTWLAWLRASERSHSLVQLISQHRLDCDATTRDALEITLQLAGVIIGQNVRRTATNLLAAWEQ